MALKNKILRGYFHFVSLMVKRHHELKKIGGTRICKLRRPISKFMDKEPRAVVSYNHKTTVVYVGWWCPLKKCVYSNLDCRKCPEYEKDYAKRLRLL